MNTLWIIVIIVIIFIFFLIRSKTSHIDKNLIVNSKQSFNEAKRHLEIAISTENKMKGHAYLGRLYHQGVPDRYSSEGAKIKGVPINIPKAIHHYTTANNLGYYPVLMDLARIYHYGIEEILPDTKKAKELYYELARIGDPYYITLAFDKIKQLTEEELEQKQLRGISTEPPKPKVPILKKENRILEKIVNDPQNVHDHTLINSAKIALDSLKGINIIKDSSVSLMEIRNYISEQEITDKTVDALRTLDFIEKTNAYVSYASMTEIELLTIVWNHPKMDPDTLLNELAECVENEHVICATGRFNRILDTLNVTAFNLVPEWMVSLEIQETIAKTRTNMESELTKTEMSLYNDDDPDFMKTFNDKLSKIVKTESYSSFSNVMSIERINAEVEKLLTFI